MVATIVGYGPYYAGRHVSAIKNGESDVSISDYRYFGDMAFCRTWQQTMRKIGLEISDEEIRCLFYGVDPKNTSTESTVNISAESPIGMAISSWEALDNADHPSSGSVPETITQTANDQDVSRLNASDAPTVGQATNVTLHWSGVAPSVEYPGMKPPLDSSHLHG